MRKFGYILGGIICTLLLMLIVGGVLYNTVEPIRNWFDNEIFNVNEEKSEEQEDVVDVPNTANIKFDINNNVLFIGG